MAKSVLILLALATPSLACIGGLFGGSSGGCCHPAAPSCSNPCGAAQAAAAPPAAGAYVTAPAGAFQAAPVLPFAAPPQAQIPNNAYVMPTVPQQAPLNLLPQVGGGQPSLGGYPTPAFDGGVQQQQVVQQQPAFIPQQQPSYIPQQQPSYIPQQPSGGYITPGVIGGQQEQQQSVYVVPQGPQQPTFEPHGTTVIEVPSGQTNVIHPQVITTGGDVSVPSVQVVPTEVVVPSSGVQGNTHTAVNVGEEPIPTDYKGVLGNIKEQKIRGKNGHQGKYDEEGGANYDDFEGYNPAQQTGGLRPVVKTLVPASHVAPVVPARVPHIPVTHKTEIVTVVTEPVRPAPVIPVTVVDPAPIAAPAPPVPSVVKSITTGSITVQPVGVEPVAPVAPIAPVAPVAPAPTNTVHVVPTTVSHPSAPVVPVPGPVTINESTNVDQGQHNNGHSGVIKTIVSQESPENVEDEDEEEEEEEVPTPSTVGEKSGGLDFHSVHQEVQAIGTTTTSAPAQTIQPFAPESTTETIEEVDGDDYDSLNEDRPEVPVAPTFKNEIVPSAHVEPTIEHTSSSEQPAPTVVPTVQVTTPKPKTNAVEGVDAATEGFDYGDDDGANYDDIPNDGKVVRLF